MSEERSILVAEDDESDVLLLQRAFKEAGLQNALHFTHDGQDAIEFFLRQRQAPDDRLPALVILDLKMPRKSGIDVLQWIRQQPGLQCLPVMIFSSSARREEIERSYLLGANGFLVKPASTAERAELARFFKAWLQFNQPPLASTEGFKSAQSAHIARNLAQSPAP
jgi:CheY-like chemotaxis protein